jgi:two-component system, OmpR family, sensor kinase
VTRRDGAQPEDRVLRNATWRLTAFTAAAITAILVVVGVVAAGVVLREQRHEAQNALRAAVVDLDDLSHASTGTSVWVHRPGRPVSTSPSAPTWLPVRTGLAAVPAAGDRDERTVRRAGVAYRVLSVHRGSALAQAAVTTETQSLERDRLVTGLIVAELAGLLLSVLLGGLIARRAMRPLAVAVARQRRFVADASHELRTPITLLSTRAQLLERSLRRAGATGPQEEAAALVADAHRLSDVVEDLLLSASLGEHPARKEHVDLTGLAHASTAAASAYAGARGVTLVVDADGPAPVDGAPGPLRRVLDALVDNAVAHTPPGGHVVIRVSAGPPARVQVVDDGVGIDPDVAPRLFDRFAHGSSTGDRQHFGLGLALVREVVEAHDGEVAAAPTLGGGATFTVTLPAGA